MTPTLYERVEAASNLVALGERARDEDPAVSAAAMGAAEALLHSIQSEYAPQIVLRDPGTSYEELPEDPADPVETPVVAEPVAAAPEKPAKKPKAEKPKPESKPEPEAEAKPETAAAVTKEQVLNAAKDFMKKQSPEALQSILKELGIKRASECPDDRLAELLARIATA